MKRWIMMLIALVVCVGFSNAQTTDKEERAKLREERRIEQERLDSLYFVQAKQAIEKRGWTLCILCRLNKLLRIEGSSLRRIG